MMINQPNVLDMSSVVHCHPVAVLCILHQLLCSRPLNLYSQLVKKSAMNTAHSCANKIWGFLEYLGWKIVWTTRNLLIASKCSVKWKRTVRDGNAEDRARKRQMICCGDHWREQQKRKEEKEKNSCFNKVNSNLFLSFMSLYKELIIYFRELPRLYGTPHALTIHLLFAWRKWTHEHRNRRSAVSRRALDGPQ